MSTGNEPRSHLGRTSARIWTLKPKRPSRFDVETLADALKDRFKGALICLEGSPIYERLKEEGEVPLVPIDFKVRNFLDLKMRPLLLEQHRDGVNLFHAHQTSYLGSVVPWFWWNPNVVLIASRHIMNNHNKKNIYHAAIYRRLDALVAMSKALRRQGRFVILHEAVITSGRKLRAYSPWEILRVLGYLATHGPRAVRQREKLEIWYGERREDPST